MTFKFKPMNKNIQDRVNLSYAVKSFGLKVEDIDPGSRKVKGYFSTFGVKDSHDDIMMPGSFKNSINQRGPKSSGNRKVAFLRNHIWEHQIGKLVELEEDEKGLMFVGQLGRSTKGNDALMDYQDGILVEHSFGFKYIADKMQYDEDDDAYRIYEVNLFEGSAVTFGSNEFTPVVEVAKTEKEKEEIFTKLVSELDAIANALKNGKGSDERLFALEMRQRALSQKFKTYFTSHNSLKPSREKLILTEKKGANKAKFLAMIANF